MPSTKNIKWTIGGPESPAGTAASRTAVIPIRGAPGLFKKATRAVDPVIIGRNMDAGEYMMQDDVSGGMPLSPRTCPGFGKLVKSLLGTESTPAQILGMIAIRYIGAQASCKLVMDSAAKTIKSYVGALGAESLDTNFGTGGTITCSGASTDTLTEIQALVDGYADYDCIIVTGDPAASVATNGPITQANVQAKNKMAYIPFGGTGAYYRNFTPDLTDTERPTYSVQGDGYQDQFLYNGVICDTLRLSAALQGMVEGDADLLGFAESLGVGASAVNLETVDPLIFYLGSTHLKDKTFTYVANWSVSIDNQSNKQGYGQGSTGRLYQQKGMLKVGGDLQLRLDANSYARRAEIFTGALASICLHLKGKLIAAQVYEHLIIELPYCSMSAFDFVDRNGVFDAKLSYKAFYPPGTVYDPAVRVHWVSTDSSAY